MQSIRGSKVPVKLAHSIQTGVNPETAEAFVDYEFSGHKFKVSATRHGVRIEGTSPFFRHNRELEPLAKVLGLAMRAHVRLEMEDKQALEALKR